MTKHDQASPIFIVNAQYLKDLSFESPSAPASLVQNEAPAIDVKLDVQVDSFEEAAYEVSLLINIEASREDNKLFVVEATYSGLFTVDNMGDDLERVLLVDCPSLLFPFARRIISNVSQDGGLPPLMLSPIDFMELYLRKKNSDLEI